MLSPCCRPPHCTVWCWSTRPAATYRLTSACTGRVGSGRTRPGPSSGSWSLHSITCTNGALRTGRNTSPGNSLLLLVCSLSIFLSNLISDTICLACSSPVTPRHVSWSCIVVLVLCLPALMANVVVVDVVSIKISEDGAFYCISCISEVYASD